jgi:predicted dinucleotide-binding enzyme
MRIAIIGTGNVGAAIARGLRDKGHAVTLGARRPDDARVQALAVDTGAAVARPEAAAAGADMVVLALPWAEAAGAVRALGDLTGRIVVDCMNPLGRTAAGFGLMIGHVTSGGETVADWLPEAQVVKTLNQVGAEIIARNDHLPARPAMFMAGDSDTAKAAVAGVLRDLGFAPLDAGDLTKARLLEPLALVWINQAIMRGMGRDWALAVVP